MRYLFVGRDNAVTCVTTTPIMDLLVAVVTMHDCANRGIPKRLILIGPLGIAHLLYLLTVTGDLVCIGVGVIDLGILCLCSMFCCRTCCDEFDAINLPANFQQCLGRRNTADMHPDHGLVGTVWVTAMDALLLMQPGPRWIGLAGLATEEELIEPEPGYGVFIRRKRTINRDHDTGTYARLIFSTVGVRRISQVSDVLLFEHLQAGIESRHLHAIHIDHNKRRSSDMRLCSHFAYGWLSVLYRPLAGRADEFGILQFTGNKVSALCLVSENNRFFRTEDLCGLTKTDVEVFR